MRKTATLALIGFSVVGSAGFALAQGVGLSSDQMTRTKDAVLQGYTPAQPAPQLNASGQPAASLATPVRSATAASTANIPSAMSSAMTPPTPGSGSGSLTVPAEMSAALGARTADQGGQLKTGPVAARGGEFEPWQMGAPARGGGEFEPWQMRAPLLGFSSALQGSSIEALPSPQSAPKLNR